MKRVWWMVLFLSVFIFGVGSISIVWLRMEISDTAKICGRMEDEREMVAREFEGSRTVDEIRRFVAEMIVAVRNKDAVLGAVARNP